MSIFDRQKITNYNSSKVDIIGQQRNLDLNSQFMNVDETVLNDQFSEEIYNCKWQLLQGNLKNKSQNNLNSENLHNRMQKGTQNIMTL